MVRKTKQEAEETRHRILDAAERVFQAHGVSRTSLQQIAEEAGVTRGAIYWHFEDKADLFNAMMDRVVLPIEAAAERSDDPSIHDPIAHLRETFVDAFRRTAHDPQVRRVFEVAVTKVEYIDELRAVQDRHLASIVRGMGHVERGLRAASRRGLLTPRVSPRSAAIGLFSLVEGLLRTWMLDDAAFDLVKVGQEVIDAYFAGLGAHGPAAAPASPKPSTAKAAPKRVKAPAAKGVSRKPSRQAGPLTA